MAAKMLKILMVEDDPEDVMFAKAELESGGLAHELFLARDGVEAIAFLRREAPHQDAPRPDVVLLDLNLPRKSGRTVLSEIRADPGLRDIPVVVLTVSQADKDMLKADKLQANFINKPPTARELRAVLRAPWTPFATVEKPRRRRKAK